MIDSLFGPLTLETTELKNVKRISETERFRLS
ncbi:MAG: hypothetical protein XD72_1999 [Methanothrix harundinacea]|jgi:hypothetical protein|uniref:Uncharacterized protein n=1 Tax=Methanothrix harundinacea TaxID=301375 RepID=A0A101FSL4_9EURY|nr:MAG: hypothetical protein XD72_1999 [Methanothrix harundinacea]KUK94546.1 MAG: hypothetical protein XE07_2121 [Methanothrix harundinacea]